MPGNESMERCRTEDSSRALAAVISGLFVPHGHSSAPVTVSATLPFNTTASSNSAASPAQPVNQQSAVVGFPSVAPRYPGSTIKPKTETGYIELPKNISAEIVRLAVSLQVIEHASLELTIATVCRTQ